MKTLTRYVVMRSDGALFEDDANVVGDHRWSTPDIEVHPTLFFTEKGARNCMRFLPERVTYRVVRATITLEDDE